MRVQVVDPSAYTPPYDHALCRALGDAGAVVELYTSRFAHGSTPPAKGYSKREFFYRRAARLQNPRARRLAKLAEHVPDMLRYRRRAEAADVVHFQWLAVQQLDGRLLPARRPGRPLVLTAHDVLPREPTKGQREAQRRLYGHFDAIVVHSEHGRARLTGELGVEPDRVHVIPHGVLSHLADGPPAGAAAEGSEMATVPSLSPLVGGAPLRSEKPVVLCFGLMRPYKGIDLLLEAWRGIEQAELWIVGMPRMDTAPLHAAAPTNVRFVERFVDDRELAVFFERAEVVVLPYREIDQSGVLFTALAFAKPLLLSDVGGFPEIAATGAARTFPAGDADALRAALAEMLADPTAREAMSEQARSLAQGEFSWASVARQTLQLYESLL